MKTISAALNLLAASAATLFFTGCATDCCKKSCTGPTAYTGKNDPVGYALGGRNTNQLMLDSGFRIVPAVTPGQQGCVEALSQGRVTVVQWSGATYYLYPDIVKNDLYLGGPEEYSAWKRLRDERNLNAEASYLGETVHGPWGDGWWNI